MSHSVYPILDLTFIADEDLSNYQYYVVELGSTEGTVKLHRTSSIYAIGVLRNKPAYGETAAVRIFGVTEVAAAPGGIPHSSPIGPYIVGGAGTGLSTVAVDGKEQYGIALESPGSNQGDLATCLVDFATAKKYSPL
jgi:hypothetical protein